jgi:hypothetical protein
MNLEELERADRIAQDWMRRLAGAAFVAWVALVVAGTVIALLPPHLTGWAHVIAVRSAVHAARHVGHARVPWAEEDVLLLLRAFVAAAWASVAVFGVGLSLGFRGKRRRVKLALF